MHVALPIALALHRQCMPDTAMLFLVRSLNNGLAAHIAHTDGHPFCKTVLKLSAWTLRDYDPATLPIICAHCRRVFLQERGRSLVGAEQDT